MLLRCRFGTEEVAARWLSGQMAECLSPPSHAQHVSMQVTSNGQRFSNGELLLEYRQAMELTYLHPVFGSSVGMSEVAVYGKNF